jgi:uncharacterized phiE125 gp8 family phage protein
MGLIRITEPTAEPLTLQEAKDWVRESTNDNDSLLTALITVARQEAENRCGRAIALARFRLTLDEFPPQIDLPYPLVRQIISLSYREPDGNLAVLDAAGYVLDNGNYTSNWVYPAQNYEWPETWDEPNGVIVEFEAGFDNQAVPENLKLWMKLAIGAWYDVRAGMDLSPLPMNTYTLPDPFFEHLLWSWKVPSI